MKATSFYLAFSLLFAHHALLAQTRSEPPPKASPTAKPPAKPVAEKPAFSTEIYEKESTLASFADTVKVIREIDGRSEVIFMKRGGPFTAPEDGAAMEKLINSQKDKSPVQVTYDEESQKITRVMVGRQNSGK